MKDSDIDLISKLDAAMDQISTADVSLGLWVLILAALLWVLCSSTGAETLARQISNS